MEGPSVNTAMAIIACRAEEPSTLIVGRATGDKVTWDILSQTGKREVLDTDLEF